MKRFDLMNGIQVRGTYAVSHACIPHMKAGTTRTSDAVAAGAAGDKWLKPTAYMMAKFGMTLCALGIAEEMRDEGIASNTLWPRTMVATPQCRTARRRGGDGRARRLRCTPTRLLILNKPARKYTGHSLLCEDVLLESGITDLSVV